MQTVYQLIGLGLSGFLVVPDSSPIDVCEAFVGVRPGALRQRTDLNLDTSGWLPQPNVDGAIAAVRVIADILDDRVWPKMLGNLFCEGHLLVESQIGIDANSSNVLHLIEGEFWRLTPKLPDQSVIGFRACRDVEAILVERRPNGGGYNGGNLGRQVLTVLLRDDHGRGIPHWCCR